VRVTLIGWVILCFGWIGVLVLRQPDDPPPSPSDRTVLARHAAARSLIEARQALAAGAPLAAARAAAAAMDQVPASPGARRVLADARQILEEERLTQATREAVDRLIGDGRDAYRDGRFSSAATLFEQALELDPDNELAASYLDLARERSRRGGGTARRTAPPTPTARPTVVAAAAPSRPRPTPGTARITVTFNSPIPAGSITVTVDGSTIGEIPFDFSTKGFLGIGRKGSGSVKKVLLAPSGRRSVGATLRDEEGAVLGTASFDRTLGAGSDWTLRLNLPSKKARAEIFLVEVSG
jgi:hypothetical protein